MLLEKSIRSENELIAALGAPLVAARPLVATNLAGLLSEHWFSERKTLAVVSAASSEGRTGCVVELARAFASRGEPTLAIDADFHAPALHRAFGLRNRRGLADFLEGATAQIASCGENLSVMVAGRPRTDPLELLSRPRLRELLAAAARRYRVVLVDTPAAARGPDLQLFAAFAGGALVVVKRPKRAALERLKEFLVHCNARVVGTVLSPA
jgi:Mrp family chromosome partitioning ATPase